MKRPWLYYISPFVLVIIVSLIPISIALLDDMMVLVLFVPVALLLLGCDYFIKWVTRSRTLYIWIIESILIVLFFVWVSYMGSFRLSGC